ncbi:SPOR domain-containing protein [Xanthomonadaceae bacterium JHOS43]|nr:SPOR domain-containing protein [Xanthomonadaceae bacterium JHOS43]
MKQRLIGAAVLVALAVIFLPMLIGGPEPDSGSSTVPVDVPPRDDRKFETRDLTLAPALPAPAPATPDPVPMQDEDRVVTVDTTDAPSRIDAVSGAPVGTELASLPSPESVTPSAAPPVTPPAATSPPAPASTSTPAATPSGRWAVNLGSYANATNASNLVSQLRGQKLPAYAEQVSHDGKAVQRVRLGPFAQRSEAESARLTVQRIRSDLPTGVVSLEGESAPPAVKAAPAEGFAVQIGALRSETDANVLRDRARAAGFASYVERIATANGALWRVRVGPELQRANADRLKSEVKTKLGIDGNVVPHP